MNAEKFIAARKASGMTLEEASELAHLSIQAYISREKNVDSFRLRELQGVYSGLSDIAKPIMRDAVAEIFLPK